MRRDQRLTDTPHVEPYIFAWHLSQSVSASVDSRRKKARQLADNGVGLNGPPGPNPKLPSAVERPFFLMFVPRSYSWKTSLSSKCFVLSILYLVHVAPGFQPGCFFKLISVESNMEAILVRQFGVLKFLASSEDVPTPKPSAGQVLVKIHPAGDASPPILTPATRQLRVSHRSLHARNRWSSVVDSVGDA